MFRHKMDLTIKVCIMPLIDYEFYKTDYLENLSKKNEITEYRKYFNKHFIRSVYKVLNQTQRVNNLDEIYLLFEKFHPKHKLNKAKDNISKYYMDLLSKLAKSFICHRNGKIALKYWESDGEGDFIGPYKGLNKIALWNSLNRMFTTDLLVVRYLLDNNMNEKEYLDGYYSSIMLADVQLDQILNKGVAETHIHKGAGINFYISWKNLMNLSGKTLAHYKEELFTDDVIGKSYGLQNYVMAIAILRLLMAYFVTKSKEDGKCNFLDYIRDLFYESEQDEKYNLICLITKLAEGKQVTDDEFKYFDLWDKIKTKLGLLNIRRDIKSCLITEDILDSILGYRFTVAENVMLFECFKYIDCVKTDEFFSKLFWQYVRIKNEVFQLKVQGNLIRGLLNFSNYYRRSTTLQGYTSKEYWKIIMLNQFQNSHLKKLELRTGLGDEKSIEKSKRYIKKVLISFLDAYKDIVVSHYSGEQSSDIPDIGLVFHMIKEVDNKEFEKCWQNFSRMNKQELYFRELHNKYMNQIKALNELREEIPGLSDFILGIDAASIENNTEPWVFASIYEEARDSKTHKNIYLHSTGKNNRIKSLGFTFHVGEDFRHLLTGIRRIDEVVEHFKFHAGDRIGHGIALGVDVDKWIKNNKIAILPRIEYLENLLWIWGLYKDGKYSRCFDIGYLEQEIMKFAEEIYSVCDGITIYNLWKAYRNKFKFFKINENYFTEQDLKGRVDLRNKLFCKHVRNADTRIWNEEKLTHAQHCRCYLEKMLEPVQIEIKNQDVEMLRQVQKIVTSKVSREGIIVETNPSSNVAIGDIESVFEHYIHNLNQNGLINKTSPENAVMISINSDDPSVFNTNVSNEFAYIFYSLQEKGYSREDALEWIDKIRRYGMESSFIDDRCLGFEQKIREINYILEKLES